MPTMVKPLRRIRIHKRRGRNGWSVYCPCCWAEDETGLYLIPAGFDDAWAWTLRHIAAKHPKAT